MKILVTGGEGFVGSHLVENMVEKRGFAKEDIIVPNSQRDDLRIFENCQRLTDGVGLVFHLAADVGGLGYSRSHPATQLRNCSLMDLNIVEAAQKNKVTKTVLVSCSPAYPQGSPQPLREENLFDGPPEKAHLGFGWAKRTMAVLAKTYHQESEMDVNVVIANNTYGPKDNFEPETSHVIPTLIRKCFEKKELVVWGDGSPRRDFVYVKDLAEGIILVAEKLNTPEPVNLASGVEVSIKELVEKIVKLTNFTGKVIYDPSKPKGQARRAVDITKARQLLGFEPRVFLEAGLRETIDWYEKKK